MKRIYKKIIVVLLMCCVVVNSTNINVKAYDLVQINDISTPTDTVTPSTESSDSSTSTQVQPENPTDSSASTAAPSTNTVEPPSTSVDSTTESLNQSIDAVVSTQHDEMTSTEVKIESEIEDNIEESTKVTTEVTTEAFSATTSAETVNDANSDIAEETTEEIDPRDSYASHTLSSEEGRIEQVQTIKPKLRAFFYMDNDDMVLTSNNVEATLGESKIEVNKVYKWGQENQLCINYYMLLDVSGSMNDEYFEAIKEEIAYFPAKHMKAGDTITIYAVGDVSECIVFEGTYDDMESIEEKVLGLENDANETYLDEAILDVVDDVNEKREINGKELSSSRDVIIAFTDGVNDSMMGPTQNEAEIALKNSGVTMYGFIEDDVTDEDSKDTKKFGEISRSTGGKEVYFNEEDIASKLGDLVDELQDVYVLEGTAEDNERSNNLEKFEIKIYDDDNQKILKFAIKEVMVDKNIPDNVPPQVDYIELISDTKLEIKFSEKVLNADDRSSYVLTKDTGENIGIENVHYDAKKDVYILYTSQIVYKGNYTVVISNITDKSMEKNPLKQIEYTQYFEGPEYEEEKESFFLKFWWVILLVFIALVIVIILIIYAVIKKNKGIVVIDNKATLTSDTDVKQHVILEKEEEGEKLTLVLSSKGKSVKTIQANVKGSVIVGRSDLCDIFIDDLAMSRQHFAIEYDGESFYVQDLDTTNGTSLNGIKLTHKRRLEPNDKITAGSLDITVRW